MVFNRFIAIGFGIYFIYFFILQNLRDEMLFRLIENSTSTRHALHSVVFPNPCYEIMKMELNFSSLIILNMISYLLLRKTKQL